jgi:hypothetical protein
MSASDGDGGVDVDVRPTVDDAAPLTEGPRGQLTEGSSSLAQWPPAHFRRGVFSRLRKKVSVPLYVS